MTKFERDILAAEWRALWAFEWRLADKYHEVLWLFRNNKKAQPNG